jgi:hypothetical protein
MRTSWSLNWAMMSLRREVGAASGRAASCQLGGSRKWQTEERTVLPIQLSVPRHLLLGQTGVRVGAIERQSVLRGVGPRISEHLCAAEAKRSSMPDRPMHSAGL